MSIAALMRQSPPLCRMAAASAAWAGFPLALRIRTRTKLSVFDTSGSSSGAANISMSQAIGPSRQSYWTTGIHPSRKVFCRARSGRSGTPWKKHSSAWRV
jgi:hypothetical protein